MLLTISTTHRPATDLGYLLHKHPARHHVAELSAGTAHVFYPEASEERCTAAVLLDIDFGRQPGIVRNRGRVRSGFALGQYVNDRPYAASSLLSVALGKLFGTAMSGRSTERPELARTAIPLQAWLPVLPCRGGDILLRQLFGPLGYAVDADRLPLDTKFPAWGDSPYLSARLATTGRLRDLLEQLFVLLPVLDDDKHYWVGPDEVGKLLRRGGEWLAAHPYRELIAQRYLRHDRRLTRDALARLLDEDASDPDLASVENDASEESAEQPIHLSDQRLAAVVNALRESGARRVLDLGCGSGKLIEALLREQVFHQITGVDVSHRALEAAASRLHLDTLAPRQRDRVQLLHGSLTYRDRRLEGFDAAAVVEVVEHLDPSRLSAFERVVFAQARPATVVLTTPNAEYNALMRGLAPGTPRHLDHRFEWSRSEFAGWTAAVARRCGYKVELRGIGPEDAALGCPTQMAVFEHEDH